MSSLYYWAIDSNGNPCLSHHGIKGQEWGKRRFQNEDGSYTEEGKRRYRIGDRYRRGKQYLREESEYATQAQNRLMRESKEYKNIQDSRDRLYKKYGIDPDDPVGVPRTSKNFNDAQLEKARERAWKLLEDSEDLKDRFNKQANAEAKDKMIKKYGDKYVSDIDHYMTINGVGVLGAAALLVGVKYLLKRAF